MRLSASLSAAGTEGIDHPIEAIGDVPLPAMPRPDPIERQTALCEAVARLVGYAQPDIVQLEALLALERQAQPLSELLLAQYVEGDGQIGSFEWKAWHAALRLSQSLFQANEYFIHHIRTTRDGSWTEQEPWVEVRLFHHRKIEFLLRFLRYKKRSTELWRQLHEMYRLARERDSKNRSDATGQAEGESRTMRKLEQQYLQILLVEAMNAGQFSPREALWAHRWFSRWSSGPGLQLAQVTGKDHFEPKGFVVDIDSTEGLKRALVAGGKLLYFDSTPLCAMIDLEMASLRNASEVAPAVLAGQLALLNKLSILFAPYPVNIHRRAERKTVALAVQVIAGFSQIVEELCRNEHRQNDRTPSAPMPDKERAVSSLGVPTFSPLFAAEAGSISLSISDSCAAPQIWQVKDRSDSGCRMRAQIDNLNLVIPGSLIAVRDGETAPWIVSVVRWFRRLMVDHVEIGVEYLGRQPRVVKMLVNDDGDSAIADTSKSASGCFAALYLPPSDNHPTMPIKTLLFPTREFRSGCDATLLSSNATYTMRLNDPIQQQFEYVWTSFAVIDKVAAPVSTMQ